MICKNCKHEIVTYRYSVQDNTASPPAIVRETYQYYHIGGPILNGRSRCSKRLQPITTMKDWEDPAGWCQCDNPEPLDEDIPTVSIPSWQCCL